MASAMEREFVVSKEVNFRSLMLSTTSRVSVVLLDSPPSVYSGATPIKRDIPQQIQKNRGHFLRHRLLMIALGLSFFSHAQGLKVVGPIS